MIQNNAHFSQTELFQLFSKELCVNLSSNFNSTSVSIDTRNIEAGAIFVAMSGSQLDSHDKLEEAIEKGAVACLVEASKKDKYEHLLETHPIIICEDTLVGLGEMAAYHRKRFGYPVVAVAGSNGKTTTKELTAHVLASKYKVLKTYENYNNRLGVPLMLLSMSSNYDCAVLEIGTNQPGEIAILANLVQPTHVLITNIGEEHLEFLIDIDGVEMEETALFTYAKKHSAFSFINMDDPRLKNYKKVLDKYLLYGSNSEAVFRSAISFDEMMTPTIVLTFADKTVKVKMNTNGYPTALSAIAAGSIASQLDMPLDQIASSLESYRTDDSHGYARMLIFKHNDYTIINDCYNANPPSMKTAIDTIRNLSVSGKRIAVLGEMRELGEASNQKHRWLLDIAAANVDYVLLIGEEFKNSYMSYEQNDNVRYFADKVEMANFLRVIAKSGDAILFKASRGIKMEEVIELFKK